MEWGKENLIVENEKIKRWNGWILLKKYLKIKVPFWMNFELICWNQRDFDDDEVENLWEKEEVKFWNFFGKKRV